MRRVRAALLAVSVAILVLVGALAWRANQGLLAERALRHRAVAERAFEEMERVLGDWLEREEARPIEHYRFYLPDSGERSPLARDLEPFVIGAFEQAADGALSAVLEPRDLAQAQARGDWPPGDETDLAIARVRRVVNDLWSQNEADDLREQEVELESTQAKAGSKRQAPGTTRTLAGPGVDSRASEDRDAGRGKLESGSAYELLQSLNRSVTDRAERKQKQTVARMAPELQAEAAYPSSVEGFRDSAEDAAEGLQALGSAAADAIAAEPAARPAEALAAPSRAAAPRRRNDTRAAVRVTLDPMLGVAVGSDSLVLYRTALLGGRAYRQGLVLDRAALGTWLSERVVLGSALASVAELRFDAAASAPASEEARYLFAHRFAEPFDSMHAELALAALPDVGSPGALAALVFLLLGVGAAGLFAVHRTASVVLQYAERRSNFVAAVTHELKTPLTAIRMYGEMLRDDLVPDEAKRREYYGTITEESERLTRLVDNVLEFSKLEGGRRELRLEAGDVGSVLRDAVDKLSAHAEREGFELSLEAESALPAVRFDRDALLQVLYNLVDNAMKYARAAESRRIVLEARKESGSVRIAVRDFGPGVARGHLDHLFEPFYRAENELTRNTKGTGIGLALVKELADRMGAAVSGANADGGGFRVGLAFPVEVA